MLTRALLFFLMSLTIVRPAYAANGADVDIKNPLSAKARLQPSRVEAGGIAELNIDMTLAANFHAYLDRFKLTIETPDDLKLDQFKVTPVVKFMDGATQSEKAGIGPGKSQLRALIEVPEGFKPGPQTARVKLVYQACTKDHCLFPKTISLDVPFEVKPTP